MRRTAVLIGVVLLIGLVVWLPTQVEPERVTTKSSDASAPVAEPRKLGEESQVPEPTPAEPAASDSREAVASGRAPALRGRVISASGDPVPAVKVAWSALEAQDIEENPSWRSSSWGLWTRATVETVTDETGSFTFVDPPREDLSHGSTVVALHPDFRPGGHDLSPPPSETEIELEMEPSRAVLVQVLDADGGAAAGAIVHHSRVLDRIGPRSEMLARHERLISDQGPTDSRGCIRMPLLGGEELFWAAKGERVSVPWRGRDPARVVLTLSPTFTAGGTITFPDHDTWPAGYTGERRVLVFGWTGMTWKCMTGLRDVGEGRWGPLQVPLGDFERFAARLEGAPIMPQVQEFARPPASSYQRFNFVAERGNDLYLFVEDDDEKPITNATAIAWWGPELPALVNSLEGASGPDGYLHLGTFPPGTVRYRVTAPGRETKDGTEQVPCPGAILVTLAPGGGIRGRCTLDGRPVRDFEVLYWREGRPVRHHSRSFSDREDGSFEFENLASGEWFVHATDLTHPAGAPATVQVRAGTVTEVELPLVTAIHGSGTILDAETGDPIEHAWVQAFTSGGLVLGLPWGNPFLTSTDGRFELDAFVPGTNFIHVGAPGHAKVERRANAKGTSLLDWGEIRLTRPQTLRVQLLGLDASTSPSSTDFRAYSSEDPVLPETRFDASGQVAFDEVPPGQVFLKVSHEDGSIAGLYLDLSPGDSWDYQFKPTGERTVDVHVTSSHGNVLERADTAYVESQEGDGLYVVRSSFLDGDGQAHFEGVRTDRAQIRVLKDTELVARRDLVFASRPGAIVEVDLDEKPLGVRVLDRDKAPLSGAWVTIRSASGVELLGVDDTDSNGLASLYGAPEGPVLMDVSHGIVGRCFGVPVDASAREIEFVLEARASLELRVADGDLALEGVEARVVSTGGISLSDVRQTDARGVVRFEPIGEGSYRLGLNRRDCWPTTVDRALRADEQASVPVQMRRLADLDLNVAGADGLPLAGCPLELESVELGTSVAAWIEEGLVESSTGTTTGALGRLSIRGLPRGKYAWRAEVEDRRAEGLLELAPGANAITVHIE